MRRITNSEAEIRLWAVRTGAHPIERYPFMPDSQPAQLSFVFGEVPEAGSSLQPIEWSRFFAVFHLMGLVLAYDDDRSFELLKLEDGKPAASNARGLEA